MNPKAGLILAVLAFSPCKRTVAQNAPYVPIRTDFATFSLLRWNPWAVHVPVRLIPEPTRAPFPTFQLPVWEAAQTLDLATLRGHIVVLDFWSRSCPSCIPLHEALVRNAPAWEPLGVQVVTVLTGESPAGLDSFFACHGGRPPFPILLDPNSSAFASAGGTSLPRLEVLDIYGRRAVERLQGHPGLAELPPLFQTLAAARDRPVVR